MTRKALVKNARSTEEVAAYMPANYRVTGETEEGVLIEGTDDLGWTLDDYVIPRLASGWMYATEVKPSPPGLDLK